MNILPMPQDGNCMFHSLASFFRSDEIDHALIRKMIVHYIYQNATLFKDEIEGSDFENVDHYCRHMSRDRAWGDGVCLQAFAMLFRVNIWVCLSDANDTVPSQISHYQGRPHLGLLLQGDHYDRIMSF